MAAHDPIAVFHPIRIVDPSLGGADLHAALQAAGYTVAGSPDTGGPVLIRHRDDRRATLAAVRQQSGPCIVVTDETEPAWIGTLAAVGVQDVILWPADRPFLAARLTMALSRHPADPSPEMPLSETPAAHLEIARLFLGNDMLAGSIIIGLRPDGTIYEWNQEAERTFGRRRSDVLGRDWLPLLVPEDQRAAEAAIFAAILAGDERRGEEIRLVTPDGAAYDTVWNISRLLGGDGQPIGIIAVGQDITERKRSEAMLERTLDRYRALLEGLPDLLFRLDAAGRFLYCHTPDDRVLLLPSDELIGRLITEVMPSDVSGPAMIALERALAQGRMQRFEYDISHREQVHHWEARIIPSGPQEATVICRDLTDMRRLQAGLVVSERMASLGLLAAGIGHELNNPLTYVSANLELTIDTLKLLYRRLPDPLLADALAPLLDAKSGAGRMREIVRNLRLFSQPQPDTHEPVSLADVVESALDLTMHQIRQRARLDVRLTAVPPVMGNASALSQVLVNLLINAVQALPEGEPDRQTIGVGVDLDAEGRIRLSVSDTGSGIAPHLLPRLFEPFMTTKAAGKGTGLGLFICHSLVTGMGGRLEVASTPGQGSVFQVVLPPGQPVDRSPARAAEVIRPAASCILVVDDTPEIGSLLARMLEDDHQTDVVYAAAEALDRLAAGRRYDVILCDLMMPGMTGMDLFAAMQERYPEQAARMVFMTGGAYTERARQFLQQVPHARLDKPFVHDEVLRAIAVVRQRAGEHGPDDGGERH